MNKVIRLRITSVKDNRTKAIQAVVENFNYSQIIAEMIIDNSWIFSTTENKLSSFINSVKNSNIEWMIMESP